jgi:cellulose synthase/poly-beta-1,6-N-acetylglucosamine synthase-like glycosyltransferase
MAIVLCVIYFAVLLALSAYGLHRYHLVILCRRNRHVLDRAAAHAGPPVADEELPIVTVQLPMFNESTVVARLLRSVARIDYPREKLHIQVLDDSIDETQVFARAEVERLKALGYDAEYVHREDRVGYKAGALEHGLTMAKGELIAVFDADFVPRPDFARALVGHFRDPRIGMVQARWAHLNRDASLLTRVQALMLDGHHMVENRARFGAGFFFNFSGTGGIWRKAAIIDAGGWQHDTLTEDLDLSYRAQLRGWKFVYRPDVVSPAELPEDVSAVRAQQYRWAKGTVQTARKLLRHVLRSPLGVGQKIEAFFHMTPHLAYPLMVALFVMLLPVLLTVHVTDWRLSFLFDLPLCLAPASSLASFYMLADTAQGRSRWGALKLVPAIIALGAGLAPSLTTAVREGLHTKAGEFVRTPKRGTNRWRYFAGLDLPLLEIAFALLSLACVWASVVNRHWFALPFTALFTVGHASIAVLVIRERAQRRSRPEAPAPALEPTPSQGGTAAAVPTDLAA